MKHTDDKGRLLSEQQAAYFKDSVVRDENGNLLTMYHGSSYDFDTFDPARIRAIESDAEYNGFWFTDDSRTLPAWTRLKRRFEVYLDLKNPAPMSVVRSVIKEIRAESDRGDEDNWHKGSRSTCDELRLRLRDMGYDGIIHDWKPEVNREELERTGQTRVFSARGFSYILAENHEYDCLDLFYYDKYEDDHRGEEITSYSDVDDYLDMQERTVVVFDPEQIKSVTNRNPEHSPYFKYEPNKEGKCPAGYTDIARDFGNGYIVKAMFSKDRNGLIPDEWYTSHLEAQRAFPGEKIVSGYCVAQASTGKEPLICSGWCPDVEAAEHEYFSRILPTLSEKVSLSERIESARTCAEQQFNLPGSVHERSR